MIVGPASRRRIAAAALAGAAAVSAFGQTPGWSLEAQRRLLAGPSANAAADLQERRRLVEDAESQLAAGDTEAAQRAFDSAASMVHSADVEMGLVRTYMQAGDYRRALAFGAHAAGAHREVPAASALYAWLLQLGGQGRFATRTLDDAIAWAPDDRALQAAREQLALPWPRPSDVLMAAPLRVAPYAVPAALPGDARAVGNAMLVDEGRQALVPAALVRDARAVWLRNGLGQTVAAVAEPVPEGAVWAQLRLAASLPGAPALRISPGEPFAGSPGYLVEYGVGSAATAAWPWLRTGFLGRTTGDGSARLLGIDAPSGPRGGPVFDAFGRLAGLAVPGPDGRDRLVSAQSLGLAAEAPADPAQRAAVDVIYESALRVALQVIVAP